MASTPNGTSRPRTLTDAVRARQARRNGEPTAAVSSRVRGASHESARRGASTEDDATRQRNDRDDSWLSRLLGPLKQLGQKFLDVLEELVSDPAEGARKFGALALASLLAKRLPGPLGWLAGLVSSYLEGERGFGFWWQVATLGVALAVGALVALLVLPVAALIGLLVAGIVMLVQRGRNKDGDEDRSDAAPQDSSAEGEQEPASATA